MQNHVLDYLNDIVEKKPDKAAFVDEENSLTFREVYEYTTRIGSFFHKAAYYHRPVLIFMEKSPQMICAFFGTIAAGDFYVPLDAEMPESRIGLIIDNCKPDYLICDEKTYAKAGDLPFDGEILLFSDLIKCQADYEAMQRIHDAALDIDPIYIVFTSGSTGVPKGVAACHRSVIDYIEQLSEVLHFDENTIFGNQTPLYFDACLKELYPTLKFGATTYLIPKRLFSYPVQLVEYLNEKRINTICWVVSALTMISAFQTFDLVKPEFLHTIAFGSEVFPLKQFRIWRETLPEAHFTNLYGPTEGTGMCCYFHCDRDIEDGEPIPIGRPFKNTQILLLDENDKQSDREGEICIRGTSVTLGYYNNPEKTSESYVQNPLNTAYPEIIYRTGDIGRYNDRGELVFASRKDYQIKHMGHRIELGEIEANANNVSGLKMCGCIYDEERDKIVLYFVGEIERGDLMLALKEKLPRYMLPNKMVKLETLPFTANGKIDRKKLKEIYHGRD